MKKNEIIAKLLCSGLLAETATVKAVNDFASKFETAIPVPTSNLDPILTPDRKGIFIPAIGRTIAIEGIIQNEAMTWQQTLIYCESNGFELPTRKEALVLMWYIEKLNTLLTSVVVDRLGESKWFWTKTQHNELCACIWCSGAWNRPNSKKNYCFVVPFFAIN